MESRDMAYEYYNPCNEIKLNQEDTELDIADRKIKEREEDEN